MGKLNNPKNLLPNCCTARLPKAAKTQNESWKIFIKNIKLLELFGWLKWWHDRRNFVLDLFQRYEDSISNQAEVIQQDGFKRQLHSFTLFYENQ